MTITYHILLGFLVESLQKCRATKSSRPPHRGGGDPTLTTTVITVYVSVAPCKGCLLVCLRLCLVFIHVIVIVSSHFWRVSPCKVGAGT